MSVISYQYFINDEISLSSFDVCVASSNRRGKKTFTNELEDETTMEKTWQMTIF